MTTIHESNGWQFKNSDQGVRFSHSKWTDAHQSTWMLLHLCPHNDALKAYSELCPLPPDPPTLEHEGILYTRTEGGTWWYLGSDGKTFFWSGFTVCSMLDRIAKQGNYAEDTE